MPRELLQKGVQQSLSAFRDLSFLLHNVDTGALRIAFRVKENIVVMQLQNSPSESVRYVVDRKNIIIEHKKRKRLEHDR